jgi:putative tryptophan/tyrosine transport system substrate-binding protein
MRRRDFITGLGGAAVLPLAARAQQGALRVIGYVGLITAEAQANGLAGFHKGLGEAGFVEGRNVAIEYRWARGEVDRMPLLAADLMRRSLSVMFLNAPPVAVLAVRRQNAALPIVFLMGEDPVKDAVVPSLNRPGGNTTGITDFTNELAGKRMGLLRDAVPKASVFALLVNPTHPNAEAEIKDTQAAAAALGRELKVLTARSEEEIEAAFVAMTQLGVGALYVSPDPVFATRNAQIVALAARHAIPAIYMRREFPEAGGLMSYEADRFETSRQAGIYVGRILKGDKPADLPVQRAVKFNFLINLKAAKALNLDIPAGILAIADEVIE